MAFAIGALLAGAAGLGGASLFGGGGGGSAASAGPAAISGLGSAGGMLLGHHLNQVAANEAMDRQKDLLTRGPQYISQGLEAAGLNRLLALNNPTTSVKAPQAGSQQGQPLFRAADLVTASQIEQQQAYAEQARSAADVAKVDAQLRRYQLPEARISAAIFSSGEGATIMRDIIRKRQYPQNMTQMFSRLAFEYLRKNPDIQAEVYTIVDFMMEQALQAIEDSKNRAAQGERDKGAPLTEPARNVRDTVEGVLQRSLDKYNRSR